MADTTMTPLKYLMAQLGITSKEYVELSIPDREDLKNWAVEEMAQGGGEKELTL